MADAGLVRTLTAAFDDDGRVVRPYQAQAPAVRSAIVEWLRSEWGAAYDSAHVLRRWPGSDALYVMTEADGATPVGCVAVDRAHFYPFVSHLYVTPRARGGGAGGRLLEVAEDYAATMGFTEAKLWCSDTLVPFYAARGWAIEPSFATPGVNVMGKAISSSPPPLQGPVGLAAQAGLADAAPVPR